MTTNRKIVNFGDDAVDNKHCWHETEQAAFLTVIKLKQQPDQSTLLPLKLTNGIGDACTVKHNFLAPRLNNLLNGRAKLITAFQSTQFS